MSRFARIFSTLYVRGIQMLHALDIVAGTLGNIIIARAVEVIKESVREGKGAGCADGKHNGFYADGYTDGCGWRGNRSA